MSIREPHGPSGPPYLGWERLLRKPWGCGGEFLHHRDGVSVPDPTETTHRRPSSEGRDPGQTQGPTVVDEGNTRDGTPWKEPRTPLTLPLGVPKQGRDRSRGGPTSVAMELKLKVDPDLQQEACELPLEGWVEVPVARYVLRTLRRSQSPVRRGRDDSGSGTTHGWVVVARDSGLGRRG